MILEIKKFVRSENSLVFVISSKLFFLTLLFLSIRLDEIKKRELEAAPIAPEKTV